MNWMGRVHGDPLSWLLEPDTENPGVRYFALRDLLDQPPDAPEVVAARADVMATGPVPVILAAQHPDGGWQKHGPGYSPKYTAVVWQVTFLAQLGADGSDPRVRRACEYVLEHSRAPYGGFTATAGNPGMIHCLQGNLCAALLDLGMAGDARLGEALDWLARSITGEGIAPASEKDAPVHYYLSGNNAPGFCCSANEKQPCAWGAVKAALALARMPDSLRSETHRQAARAAAEFLLSRDPAVADYPIPSYSGKPNQSWFKFGYPIGYVTDVLQNLEALALLGNGCDPRLENALRLVLNKQDAEGRWKMEYSYNGKTWVDVEKKGKPSKWVTLRALRVLKAASG